MKFLTRSILILLALYGLLFAFVDVVLIRSGAPIWLDFLFPIAFVGFQYLVSPYVIGWVLDIVWDDSGKDLPARNRARPNRKNQHNATAKHRLHSHDLEHTTPRVACRPHSTFPS